MKVNGISTIASQPIRTSNVSYNTNVLRTNDLKDNVNFGNKNITKVIAKEHRTTLLRSFCRLLKMPLPPITLIRETTSDNIYCILDNRLNDSQTMFNVDSLVQSENGNYVSLKEGVNTGIKPGIIDKLLSSKDSQFVCYGLTRHEGIPVVYIQSEPDKVSLINLFDINEKIMNGTINDDVEYAKRYDEYGYSIFVSNDSGRLLEETTFNNGLMKAKTLYKADNQKGNIKLYLGDKAEEDYTYIVINPEALTISAVSAEDGKRVAQTVMRYSSKDKMNLEDIINKFESNEEKDLDSLFKQFQFTDAADDSYKNFGVIGEPDNYKKYVFPRKNESPETMIQCFEFNNIRGTQCLKNIDRNTQIDEI